MRLKSFFFIFSLLGVSVSWGQSIFHICPTLTPTCICSTTLQAQQTMTTTTTPGIVEYDANLSENITIGNNAIGVFQGSGNRSVTVSSAAATATFQTGTGLTVPITIQNLAILNSSTSQAFFTNLLGAGASINLLNDFIDQSNSSSAVQINFVASTAKTFVINDCYLKGESGFGLREGGIETVADAIDVKNSIIQGRANIGYLNQSTSLNLTANFLNCDFYSSSVIGVSVIGEIAVTNCLFLSNGTDYVGNSNAVTTKLVYCGFGTLASGAGTSCIYGLTTAKEFCDQNNFWISSASATRNKGISITGFTGSIAGINGILQGYSGQQDMGCNPYSSALCSGLGEGK